MSLAPERPFFTSPYAYCLGAILIAACLRLWLFNGLYGHDDWVYLFYTRSHLNGDNRELVNVISGLRWGVWLPVATLFKLFGVHYWLTFLPGFLAGLACIPIAYLIGLKISGSHHVARWAAAALIINPVDWFVSTTLRGDIEISFFSGLILLGLVCLEAKPQKTPFPFLLPFAIGLVWGLATLTKEWAFIFGWAFFAVVLFKLIRERRIAWHYLYILLGLGVILVIDGFILYQITENPFQRFERSLMLYDILRAEGAFVNDLSLSYRYLPSIMLNIDSAYRDHQRFVNGYPYYGYYFYVGLLSLGYALWTFRRAKAASWLVAGFLLGLLLWMQFGSMSLKVYTPYHDCPAVSCFIPII